MNNEPTSTICASGRIAILINLNRYNNITIEKGGYYFNFSFEQSTNVCIDFR